MSINTNGKSKAIQRPDRLSRYLKDLGVRRFNHLMQQTGISEAKLMTWRDDPTSQIRYVDALRLVLHAKGDLAMRDFADRKMSDRAKFDNPLGRKVAMNLIDGTTLGSILNDNGITHVELGRWLTENVKWHPSTRKKIKRAFTRGDIVITDQDFDEQQVDRLRVRYEEARDSLNRRSGEAHK